jgi:hypothetical protein
MGSISPAERNWRREELGIAAHTISGEETEFTPGTAQFA